MNPNRGEDKDRRRESQSRENQSQQQGDQPQQEPYSQREGYRHPPSRELRSQQGGQPRQQGSLPPQQESLPSQQGGQPPQQPDQSYQQHPPQQQGGQPPQQRGQPTQQGGQPTQQGGQPTQQGGQPSQQPDQSYQSRRFSPQEAGMPPHRGGLEPEPSEQQPQQAGQAPPQSDMPPQQTGREPPQSDQPAQQYQPRLPQLASSPPRTGPMQISTDLPSQTEAVQRQSPPQMQPPTRERPELRTVSVEEILETDVVTAQRDTPIPTVAAKMAEKFVGSVVIVEGDKPVGILTDRKIALALETTPDISDRTADDLISGEVVTGTLDTSIFDALRKLDDEQIRRLPIVNEEGTLEGIVTLDDIIVLLGAELQHATSIIKGQSRRL